MLDVAIDVAFIEEHSTVYSQFGCWKLLYAYIVCFVSARVRANRLSRAGPLPNSKGPFEILSGPGPAGPAVVSPR
jgi:hypothetical protein